LAGNEGDTLPQSNNNMTIDADKFAKLETNTNPGI